MSDVRFKGKLYSDYFLQAEYNGDGTIGTFWKADDTGYADMLDSAPGAGAQYLRGVAYTDGAMHTIDSAPGASSAYIDGVAVTNGRVHITTAAVGPSTVYRYGRAVTGGRLHVTLHSSGYTGPLDLVSGAVVAFGQRAMSAAMVGQPLYTLRRSSDDAEVTYSSDASGNAPVADIASWIGGGSGYVKTWNDQSGNASNATQATLASQPQYTANSFGSVPAFSFDGSKVISTPSISISGGGCTCFAVVNIDQAGFSGRFSGINYYDFSAPYSAFGFGVYGTPVTLEQLLIDIYDTGFSNEVGGYNNTSGPFSGANKLLDVSATFGTLVLEVNGATLSNDHVYDTGALVGSIVGPLALGADDAADQVTAYIGTLAEYIIFAGVLSDADRIAVRQNIATYYGISL